MVAVTVNEAGARGAVVAAAVEAALAADGIPAADVPDEAAARALVEAGEATVAIILPEDLDRRRP